MKKELARIIGIGSYLPKKVLSNADLEKMVETTDEWIVQRTGVKERRIAAVDESSSDMGAEAAKKALSDAGIAATDVDMIVVATMTPDHLAPTNASIIQRHLGAENASAMDVQAACTGFIYGLSIAKAYVESGLAKCILLVATEKMSTVVDYTDRNTCILFGDGAAAAVITGSGDGLVIDTICLGSDGNQADLIVVPAGGSRLPTSAETVAGRLHYVRLEGREVFKHAVRRMATAAQECLRRAQLDASQIKWLLPHQANERIMNATAESVGVPLDKMIKTVDKYGNTSASGVAIALDELIREKPLNDNEHLLLVAFGAGLTWGAALLTQKRGT
jgi:3-oxoacyl-(acyl-carrier-protein) synthase III